MKKINYILYGILALTSFAGCSSEDELTAERDDRVDYFLPDPNATDEISVLRREFYKEQGSYLLFNDTLRNEPLGEDYNGDMKYFTETVDVSYSIGSSSTSVIKYYYELLQEKSDMLQSVTFLKERVLPHLSESLRPFSWLITHTITQEYNGSTEELNALSGERCIAIAVGDLAEMDSDEQESTAKSILATVITRMLNGKDSELQDFYSISEKYYNSSFSMSNYSDNNENMRKLNERGFIVPCWLIEGIWMWRGRCPAKDKDLASYISLIFNNTEEYVRETYADYPIVLQKYDVLKGLFNSLGYID